LILINISDKLQLSNCDNNCTIIRFNFFNN